MAVLTLIKNISSGQVRAVTYLTGPTQAFCGWTFFSVNMNIDEF